MATEIFFKEWREFAGYTQDQMAKLLKISKAQLSRIESGERDYNGKFLTAFSTACFCSSLADPITRPPDTSRLPGRKVFMAHSLSAEEMEKIERVSDILKRFKG